MQPSIEYWRKELQLEPHSEGGFFKETARSEQTIKTSRGQRPLYTSILFLLTDKNPSHLHRLNSDETWYYHANDPLSIHCIFPDGHYQEIVIGPQVDKGQVLSYTVPKNTIFGSSVAQGHSLVSCVVAPGFDYRDFELFTQEELLKLYPQHQTIIKQLAYQSLPH
ncbi:cupin domain-containing protein [Bombilactobacillus folatiphilus]|uniref:Cupin domain-containing protein n=1 Tax=Bombilactobacillus folatiphilus TaxID=2923362 RepID=A0ABY4P727_9LACO|nr:cupin domain-containing protein [Bombilactobacillus folatiphilus]UQS81452.1 cupin domain-containing protein [Bombilactobacillus folatiphilus]